MDNNIEKGGIGALGTILFLIIIVGIIIYFFNSSEPSVEEPEPKEGCPEGKVVCGTKCLDSCPSAEEAVIEEESPVDLDDPGVQDNIFVSQLSTSMDSDMGSVAELNSNGISQLSSESEPAPAALPVSEPAVKQFDSFICERKKGTLSCPAGKKIKVVQAYYGREAQFQVKNSSACPHSAYKCNSRCLQRDESGNTVCRKNIMSWAVANLNGKQIASIVPSNSLFGTDPCGGVYKMTSIKYECI